jgi:hypothetical protein
MLNSFTKFGAIRSSSKPSIVAVSGLEGGHRALAQNQTPVDFDRAASVERQRLTASLRKPGNPAEGLKPNSIALTSPTFL